MRLIPPDLQAHLDSGATTLCWCWRVVRADGVTLGFTDHDVELSFDGTVFEPASGFTASEARETIGLNVDSLDIDGVLRSDRLEERDIAAGRYDGAGIEMFRVNWSDPAQRVLLRRGTMGEITRNAEIFHAEFRGLTDKLNQPTGRVYQRTCDADLGDVRCGVDLAVPQFIANGTVQDVPAPSRVVVAGFAGFDAGWFQHGVLAWTSGANAGDRGQIKAHRLQPGLVTFELWAPPATTPLPGDTFEATAGCDKALATCRDKFANAVNFRGFPHIPGNDFVTRYPNSDDAR